MHKEGKSYFLFQLLAIRVRHGRPVHIPKRISPKLDKKKLCLFLDLKWYGKSILIFEIFYYFYYYGF